MKMWGEDRFPFFVSQTITDESLKKDIVRLLLFFDISIVKYDNKAFAKERYGEIRFCVNGHFEFLNSVDWSDTDGNAVMVNVRKKGDKYCVCGKMTDVMHYCKKVTTGMTESEGTEPSFLRKLLRL